MYFQFSKFIPKNSNMKWGYLFTVIGIATALLLVVGLRFAYIKDDSVHHHANFAVYINGQQEKFDNPLLYEEIASCSSHEFVDPKHRVHMHNEESHLVHVHADGVTWGHFFANIGHGITKDLLQTDTDIYIDGQNDKNLKFYLNGEYVDSIANKLIDSEDVLVIDYGITSDEKIISEFDAIPRDAHEANNTQDPATCSGSTQSSSDKLLNALKFWQ